MDACVRQAIQEKTTPKAQIIGPRLELMGVWTGIQKQGYTVESEKPAEWSS